MKVLITGASGFIGRNLVEELQKKYFLLTPAHKELNLLNQKDVSNYFKKNSIDCIIHCAVYGGSRISEQVDNSLYKNLRIFFNIIHNKNKFKKIIFIGSGAEYDKSKPIIKVKEEDYDKSIPKDNYGFYKYICSKYIKEVNYIVNLRLFGIFGKYEKYKLRFISNSICKSIFGIPITINRNVVFDYLYIKDFVRIADFFIQNNVNEKFYNIGRGKSIDLLSIAKIINEISDNKVDIIIKNKSLGNEYTCNNTRLINELGNFKFTDLKKSIRGLYQWYLGIKNTLKKEDFTKDLD